MLLVTLSSRTHSSSSPGLVASFISEACDTSSTASQATRASGEEGPNFLEIDMASWIKVSVEDDSVVENSGSTIGAGKGRRSKCLCGRCQGQGEDTGSGEEFHCDFDCGCIVLFCLYDL